MGANNKRLGLAGAALACVLPFAGSASAADWSGAYVGGNLGYGWGEADTKFDGLPPGSGTIGSVPTPKPKGVLVGAQAGYNWQNGNLVYGAETDFSLTGMSDKKSKSPFLFNGAPVPGSTLSSKQDIDWIATLRARLGVAPADKWLLYGTGGIAWVRLTDKGVAQSPFVKYAPSDTGTKVGWAAGVGAEWAMMTQVSLKFEYLHYDLGHTTAVGNPNPPNPPFQTRARWDSKGDLLRAGVNFRF